LYLQYDRADTVPSGGGETVVAQALSANYAFSVRNFDNLPFPTSGWGLGLEVGGGSTLGMERKPYTRLVTRGLAIVGLGEGRGTGQLALRGEAGAVLAEPDALLPSTQLFLTGGDNTVRGYGLRSIGVQRSDGQLDAGRYLLAGSVEWQHPLQRPGMTDWDATLFVDAGAVADTPSALSAQVGVGAGLRWRSPIGPLQIDLAYGVAVQRWRLHLNVGFNF
ncbi:MAG: outer membrane protein assembly factor, partial [Rhodoferax sp.]|nr:outer membrane protein assembly factor [Rhodoferax sp.]